MSLSHLYLWHQLVIVVIIVMMQQMVEGLSCMDNNNKAVDWYILYKMPRQSQSKVASIRKGLGYFYMDVNNPKWIFGKSSLDLSTQPVGYTLEQINKNLDKILYAMYNDETPFGKKTESRGHTKGVLASDKKAGFWMIHSAPKFPTVTPYSYPSTAEHYGQLFFCMTLPYDQLSTVGDVLRYTYPLVYNYSLPASYAADVPVLRRVLDSHERVTSAPWNRTHILTTSAGQKLQAFSKSSSYNAEIYSEWIAPYYQSNLCTETWQNGRGKLQSNCTAKYKVYNNEYVQISDSQVSVEIKETVDHSKWAVTVDQPRSEIVCIGGINRELRQETRGGGTVCMKIAEVYAAFHGALRTRETCDDKLQQSVAADKLQQPIAVDKL